MTITANLNANLTTLTVTSDRRKLVIEAKAVGETVTCTGLFPVTVTDVNKTWVQQSVDGITAVDK